VLVEGAADVLVRLSSVVDELAVISGRPLAYLDARLPPGLTMVGLYGLETVRGGERVDHPDAPEWRAVVAEVVALAERTGPEGLHVESKDLSLTLHYRQHPELAERVAELAHELAGPSGLRVHPAKMSLELHPPIDEDKGTALTRLASDHDGPVMFLGDDVGDLTAFDALDRLAARGRHVLRVVAGSDETDPRVRDRADLVVDGPSGVLDLLASLLD
jgi:trehalose 6-phosphate phosphatase